MRMLTIEQMKTKLQKTEDELALLKTHHAQEVAELEEQLELFHKWYNELKSIYAQGTKDVFCFDEMLQDMRWGNFEDYEPYQWQALADFLLKLLMYMHKQMEM